MASTPSASALSAVLRCRGNIWTRNSPNKRPATSGCSLGLGGGALRDTLTERSRSKQTSAWAAFLQGNRVVVGGRLTVVCESTQVDGKTLRKGDCMEINKLVYSKLSQSTGHAQSVAKNAPVHQLAHRLIFKLPGVDKCSKIIQMIKYETYAEHICKIAFVSGASGSPAGVLKVSIVSPSLMEHSVLKTLQSTCLSLTALVSEMTLLWRSNSSPDGAPQPLLCQQDKKVIKPKVVQANGHSSTDITSSKVNSGCGHMVTEDRPD